MGLVFWLAILVMLLGLIGTVLPVLPGIPLIFLAILAYAYLTHFTSVGIWFILVMGILTAFSLLVDYLGTVYGARRYGASRFGIWGSVFGGIIGLIFFPPLGIILGTLLGAVLGEILVGKSTVQAFEVGWGSLIGFLGGSIVKVVIGLIMIFSFIALTLI